MIVIHRLVELGWSLESLPGEPLVAVRDDDRLAPVQRLHARLDGELEAEPWQAELERLGILELELGPAKGHEDEKDDEFEDDEELDEGEWEEGPRHAMSA